jgi:hypothetical protein
VTAALDELAERLATPAELDELLAELAERETAGAR